MKKFIRLCDGLSVLSCWICIVLLLIALVMVLAEVFLRVLCNGTLYITVEYSGYIMVALTFIGMSYCHHEGGHIRMTFIHNVFREKRRAILEIVILSVAVVLSAYVTYRLGLFFQEALVSRARSMQISKTYLAIPKFFMPFGCALYCIQCLGDICRCILCIKENDYSRFRTEEIEDVMS